MKITVKDLKRWAVDSVKWSVELGFDQAILQEVLVKTRFTVLPGLPPSPLWYGRAFYSKEIPEVQVYERNMSTEGVKFVKEQFEKKNVPAKLISPIISAMRLFPEPLLFEFNQAGMDHELIGHMYNFFAGKRHDEQAACDTQIELARRRGRSWRLHWNLLSALSPVILRYHKKDEFITKE